MLWVTACAHSTRVVTATELVYRDPPEELLHCPFQKPQPPAHGAIAGAWGVYILRLESWGEGCRARLEDDLAGWVRSHHALPR